MEAEILIPQTRGRKKRYNFENMAVGETRGYQNTDTNKLLGSAKTWAVRKGLDWKFRCYTLDGFAHIVRVK